MAVTVAAGVVLWLFHRFSSREEDVAAQAPEAKPAPDECCGLHAVCEKQAAALAAPEYFDDEELDRFAGRKPDSYTDGEVEEFREVLYTLLPADVYPWGISLTHRNIALPLTLRDEWMMLCEDAKTK